MIRPRALFVGRTRYRLPLSESLARKWDALSAELDLRVLARGTGTGDSRFRLVLPENGFLYEARLPFALAQELRRFQPDAVVVQSPHEATLALAARRMAGVNAPIVLEIHGDWHTATRFYGSPLRKLLTPLADATATVGVKRAEVVRALSPFTSGLVQEVRGRAPDAHFPTYSDFSLFTAEPPIPLPARPLALFVGVLEPYKGVDWLDAAWRAAAPQAPGAALKIVGRGPQRAVIEALVRDLPTQTEWIDRLEPPDVVKALDEATLLVLPSRSEGLPRVAMESLLRGRPIVGSTGGGIPDLVEDGKNGVLARSPAELAEALVRVLTDGALAERLAQGAAASERPWLMGPEELARRTRELVEQAAATRR